MTLQTKGVDSTKAPPASQLRYINSNSNSLSVSCRIQWFVVLVTLTRTELLRSGRNLGRPSLGRRSWSWRSDSTDRSILHRQNDRPLRRHSACPTLKSKPGSKIDEPNGGKHVYHCCCGGRRRSDPSNSFMLRIYIAPLQETIQKRSQARHDYIKKTLRDLVLVELL